MFDPILNFSYATIVMPPSPADSGSTFTIVNSEDIFPDPLTDGEFNITVWASGQLPKNSNATIVRVTDKSVGATHTTFTFTRTQESSNNRDIVAGDQVILSITKKTIDDIRNEIIIGRNLSAGCSVHPTYTNNGSGNITVNQCTVRLFSTADFTGAINEYILAPITVTLTDNTTNYVVADYNSGTPILKVITDVSLINESNVTPVYTIIRTGTVLHTLDWNQMGLGLSNKIHQRLVKTERFVRESGLALSETGTRNLVLSTGVVWYGAKAQTLDAINTTIDNLRFYYHVGGVWTVSHTEVSYNNTQYDNGTDLVTLTANRYAVIWVFRGVEDQKHLYAVLGTGDYTLTQAQSATVPALPSAITSHAILVGKVIIQKSASTATSIQSAFDTSFSFASASAHNDLIGIQGGTTNEYYHLTSAQYNSVVSGQNSFITREVVNETPNGTITAFTVDSTPVSGSECVYLDGLLQNVGAGNDYTISGSTITFNIAPPTGSVILVSYQYSTSTSGNADTLDGQHAPTGTIVGTTDTQTLTNKELTSPKINENVVITATSTEINKLDGTPTNLLGNLSANNEFIQRGKATISCPSGVSYTTAVITFPTAFTTLQNIQLCAGPYDNFTVPELPIINYGNTTNASQIQVFVSTKGGGNWVATRTLNLYWMAIGN